MRAQYFVCEERRPASCRSDSFDITAVTTDQVKMVKTHAIEQNMSRGRRDCGP